MKRLAGAVLVLALAASTTGCVYHSAIAQGPAQDKVFITKTTNYLIWSVNKMELCNWNGTKATDCQKVTEE